MHKLSHGEIYERVYYPGAKVECVDDEFPASAREILPELPRKGQIYTVESFDFTREHDGRRLRPSIRLRELQARPRMAGLAIPRWAVSRFRLFLDERNRDLGEALARLETVTPRIRDLLTSPGTPQAFKANILTALVSLEGWYELACGNAMLAVMVANCPCYDGQPESGSAKRMKEYLQKKRREVCAAFGMPGTEAAVALLAKLDARDMGDCPPLWLGVLHLLMRHDSVAPKLLARRTRITAWEICSLGFGTHLPFFDNAVHWEELASMKWFFSSPLQERALLLDAWQQAKFWKGAVVEALAGPLRRVASFKKISAATAGFHAMAAQRRAIHFATRKVIKSRSRTCAWPEPPVRPENGIVAIPSAAELVAEGIEMNHCAADYIDRVMSGEAFLYRITSPERCTLCLKYSHGLWKIDQLRAFNNRPATNPDTARMVAEWLSRHPTDLPNNPWLDFLEAVRNAARVSVGNDEG